MAVASVISVTGPTVSDLHIFGPRIDDGVRGSATCFVDRAAHETTSATMVRTDGDFDSGDSDYTWLERDEFSSKRHHAQN
jgi:hypothetical protein